MTKVKDTVDTVHTLGFAEPFGKDIPNDDLFKHQQLVDLQNVLKAGICNKVGMLVTGPAGSGKTTSVRSVTDELPGHRYSVVYLGQDREAVNALKRFVGALGLPARRYRSQLSQQASQWLLENLAEGGKEILLVVDEAHLLEDKLLEELRLMTNADYDRKSPLTLLLLGQPVLRLRLKAPDFEALYQRLPYRFRLEGLNQDETAEYVKRRLSVSGLPGDLFPAEVVQYIFHVSEGLPRRVNNICSVALLKAKAAKRSTMDLPFLKEIVEQD